VIASRKIPRNPKLARAAYIPADISDFILTETRLALFQGKGDGMRTSTSGAFRVVCLGGSAGGLEPYMTICGNLEPDTGMAYIVAQHRAPHLPELLPSILRRVSRLPVLDIEQGTRLEPDTIYVLPPRTLLTLEGEVCILRAAPVMTGWPRTISDLLLSMALTLGPRAVAVILSGMDADGAGALKYIKAAGGIVFAQARPAFESMPVHAMETGHVDHVLPAHGIAAALNALGGHHDRSVLGAAE
jgi:two-component system CheB/CheR fusion protein